MAALMLMFTTATASAQMRRRARPLVVKFTGVFQPYDKQAANALQTLTVSHKDDTWLFKVDRVNVIGGGQDPGTMLLSRIFPPRLAISGPKDFIESLKNPKTMGKRFALQGWLDLKVRTFRVAEVKEEPGGAPQDQFEQPAPGQPEPAGPAEPPTDLPFTLENSDHLVDNAIKFTRQGKVSVVAEARAGGVEFCVSDTGIGIGPEVMPHIFELFRQGDRTMTRRYGGVGLGLYLVRRMLELLGGK
jgi:hypothetical protein